MSSGCSPRSSRDSDGRTVTGVAGSGATDPATYEKGHRDEQYGIFRRIVETGTSPGRATASPTRVRVRRSHEGDPMTSASDLLAAHAFLAGMSEEHLVRLSYWSRRSVFHAGTRVFNEGTRADRFWLIREGEVRLDTRLPGSGEVIVETVRAGTVLGWSWMFPPYRWRFGATAIGPVLAMEFDASGVRRLCDSDPELGYDLTRRFMAVVIDRLQATRVRLLDAHGCPPAGPTPTPLPA